MTIYSAQHIGISKYFLVAGIVSAVLLVGFFLAARGKITLSVGSKPYCLKGYACKIMQRHPGEVIFFTHRCN